MHRFFSKTSPSTLERHPPPWVLTSAAAKVADVFFLLSLEFIKSSSRAMLALVTADILIKDSLNIIVLSVVLILTLAGYLFTQRKDSSTVRF